MFTFSGLITVVRQEYKMHNQFLENCYWLVIGSTVQRFLRRRYTNWGLVAPPRLKPSRLHVPNRSGFCASFRQGNLGGKKQIQFVGNMCKIIKWCNNNDFFLATYFYNPCSVVYFSLISSSYIKGEITDVNNVTWTTTFNAHQNTYLRFSFCLSEKEN